MIKKDINEQETIELLQSVCSKIDNYWKKHLDFWECDERGYYNDISVFSEYVVDRYENGETEDFEKIFQVIEKVIEKGTAAAQEKFSNIFSSYLITSFDLIKNPGKILYSPNAHCFCPICSWLINAPYLKTKKITLKAKRRAEKLKHQYLGELCMDIEVQLSTDEINQIIRREDIREELSLVTYAKQLLFRMDGRKEGPALLVLWRAFAWTAQGSPKKKFKLKAETILMAEEKIVQLVKNTKRLTQNMFFHIGLLC